MNTTERVFTVLKPGVTVSLASVTPSGYPRCVPMKVVAVDGKKNIWFATSLKSEKVTAYRRNPRAGVSYYNDEMSVSLQGNLRIVEEGRRKREMWDEAMTIYFPDGADSRDYCLLCFSPELLRTVMIRDIYKYEVKTIVLLNN